MCFKKQKALKAESLGDKTLHKAKNFKWPYSGIYFLNNKLKKIF